MRPRWKRSDNVILLSSPDPEIQIVQNNYNCIIFVGSNDDNNLQTTITHDKISMSQLIRNHFTNVFMKFL